MKRFHLLFAGLALGAAVAVGYSDSHEIKKESVQVNDTEYSMNIYQPSAFVAEVPVDMIVDAPYLGSPASNYTWVSEELTDVTKMCIRPPPEKVQKSDYNYRS